MSDQLNKDKPHSQRLAELFPEFAKNPRSWVAMVEKYEDDVKNWGDSLQMLQLVKWLSAQEYSSMFYPDTSLMKLCIVLDP
jgi:hypothetical protein